MSRKFYFWNTDECTLKGNVSIELGHPMLKEKITTLDAPWEGNTVNYFNVVSWAGRYYLYYGANAYPPYECEHLMHRIAFCVMTSDDGIHFVRPKLDHVDFFGYKQNNIVWIGGEKTDNFTVMVDENPNCPAEERFKAMVGGVERLESGRNIGILDCYVSPDGFHFTYKMRMNVTGNFDSQNTLIYDKDKGQYVLYSRKMSGSPESPTWGGIRTIRVCYSKDLQTFTEPKTITYSDDYPFEMYTNGIRKYGDVYVGTPTRYLDRVQDTHSIESLPDYANRKQVIEQFGRSGTAMTDSLFMFSRDGENFYRFPEAFFTPGVESARNWYYGDCYLSHGHVVTKSGFEGAPDEISMYLCRNYRTDKACELWRATLRQDGFAYVNAKYAGGEVALNGVPFTDKMSLNFATSSSGFVRVHLYLNDKEVYQSQKEFGDSIRRTIPLPMVVIDECSGKNVDVVFEMCDAKLFSVEM